MKKKEQIILKNRRVTALNAVLADMDERYLPSGDRKVFSIAFYSKNGAFHYFHKAIAVGVRQNMKKFGFKGVVPVDTAGNEIGHRYPVWIHLIILYKSDFYKANLFKMYDL